MITRILLFIADRALRLVVRRIKSTGPLPWTPGEQARFREGFSTGLIEGERRGFERGYRRAFVCVRDGIDMAETVYPKIGEA